MNWHFVAFENSSVAENKDSWRCYPMFYMSIVELGQRTVVILREQYQLAGLMFTKCKIFNHKVDS
ncbi:hypothetical protein IQ13_0984 [Lacibacter cauensis]|uniref:Uncharacterized protein n=1 Tax=Lacibacter cauensis TaxID=510947 RepID=A0A562SFM0_9BACT|nr:hypothetical protein IQ13_2781 [Lacibacter cauensis]TWI85815.1 hypothetical protein IQ13_0984 [Lacibacter cauensis]